MIAALSIGAAQIRQSAQFFRFFYRIDDDGTDNRHLRGCGIPVADLAKRDD
jgi:hypothetical protein